MSLLFKEHLRILHDLEDDLIMLYLTGAIDAIENYASRDIFLTQYEVYYTKPDYRTPSNLMGWFCGKWDIAAISIVNSAGVDITDQFTIDKLHGMVYPHPRGHKITFFSGFNGVSEMPPNLVNIIFRYGAHLYENRESVRVGTPKNLPDWVEFALASIWVPNT